MKIKRCFSFKQLHLSQCKIYWFPVLLRLRNVLNWTHWIQNQSFFHTAEQGCRSQLNFSRSVSLTCALAAWEHCDFQQWVHSEILALLDVTQGLKEPVYIWFACLKSTRWWGCVLQNMKDKRAEDLGLGTQPYLVLGLSMMRVETALGQHKQQGGGPGKAALNLCFSKFHAWMWFWILSRILGLFLLTGACSFS